MNVYIHDLGPNRNSREFRSLTEARKSAQARADKTGKKVTIDRIKLDSNGSPAGQRMHSTVTPRKASKSISSRKRPQKPSDSFFDAIFGSSRF